MKETTKKQFNDFKKFCEYYIKKFQVNDWKVYYHHVDLERDSYANTGLNLQGRVATITLNKVLKEDALRQLPPVLKETAKHEVLHVLLGRLTECGLARFVTDSEIYEAEEEAIRRLELLLD